MAVGRSDIDLKLELVKKILEISLLLMIMRYGVLAIAYSLILTSVINQIVNSWPNRKLIGYSYFQQMRDILPEFALACIMGAVVYAVGLFKMNDFLLLFLQIITGTIVYIGASAIMKLEAFMYLVGKIKQSRKID